MLIMGIDTSTLTTSVGIIEDGVIVGEFNLRGSMYNSESLMEMMDSIFSKLSIEISDIDLFVTGVGPGSFTGIRIGVTVAKTLAQTLGEEVLGVSSLGAMALNHIGEVIVPIIDARRDRGFFGIYENSSDFKTIREDALMDNSQIVEELSNYERVILTGEGAPDFYEKFKSVSKNLILPPNKDYFIRGVNVARLGEILYKNGKRDDLTLVPNYLNISQAERNLKNEN